MSEIKSEICKYAERCSTSIYRRHEKKIAAMCNACQTPEELALASSMIASYCENIWAVDKMWHAWYLSDIPENSFKLGPLFSEPEYCQIFSEHFTVTLMAYAIRDCIEPRLRGLSK